MARKNQTLLNYRTSGTTMPLSGDVQHGEIVVRYATDKPELLIKKKNQEFATFIDSVAIKSLIEAGGETAAGQLKSFSASVVANYATSADTVAAINSASGNIETTINTVSGYIETKINTVSGNIKSTIEAVKKDVAQNKTDISNLSTSLSQNYATSADTVAAIKSASGNIETTIKTLSGNVVTYVKTVSGNIETKINTVSGNIKSTIETVKGDVTSLTEELRKGYWTSAETSTKIDEKVSAAVSSVYKVKGSVKAFAELPTTGNTEGDVYNVVEANGNTPAGTNYVWVVDGESNGHWDPLGGTVDLSEYAKTSEVDKKIGVVSSDLETFKTNVAKTYATQASLTALSGNAHSAIVGVSGNVANLSKELHDGYWTSAETQAKITAVDNKVGQNKTSISELSASVIATYATSADTVAAIKSASGNIETTINAVTGNLNTFKTDVAKTYATKTELTTASGTLKTSIETVDGRVTTLNNKLTNEYATSAATVTALQSKIATATFNTFEGAATSTQSGAKMLVGGNADSKTLTIDLSALVIDCGEF